MYCKKCGAQITANSTFCPVCGQKVTNEDQSSEFQVVQEMEARDETTVLDVQQMNQSHTSQITPEVSASYQPQQQITTPQVNTPQPNPQMNWNPELMPGAPMGVPQPAPAKKSRVGLIIGIIVAIVVVAAVGVTCFLGVQASKPEAAVERVFSCMENGDWEGMIDNIYFADPADEQEARSQVSSTPGEVGSLFGMVDLKIVSVGESYLNSDGIECRDVTVEMSALGQSSGEQTLVVCKSDEKVFFFFDKWKIYGESMF